MPAATTKEDLLTITRKEFAKFEKLIEDVGENEALSKDDEDTSIKDVVAHRAHWIGLFLGWHSDGLEGKKVYFPAKGYKWNQLKAYNTDLRQRQQGLGWAMAKEELKSAHDQLLAFINNQTDRELYDGPMKGAYNDWTLGRWAEAAGPSHYRSAAKYVRARLRSIRD